MKMRVIQSAVAIFVMLSLSGSAKHLEAQPDAHEQHHPENKSAADPSPAVPDALTPGGVGGMEKMMEQLAAPPPKELYPSLMDLPNVSPERRTEVERLAHERMRASRELVSAAAGRLSAAASRDDYAGMQEATAEIREALSQFDSGLAAHRVLAEGKAPRDIALQWFKREMNLLPTAGVEPGSRILGLSWFHYFVIVILAAFAVATIGMYFHRMRRAEALLTQLGAAPPDAAMPAPVSPGAAVLAAPAAPVIAAKWSGQLRVARIFQETADVKTFRLAAPDGSEFLPFTFDPGQFLTVSVKVDGKDLKRSYSLSSSPCCQGWCEFTVKHVAGGRVSAYLHEQVREGDPLDVSAPSGRFTFRGKEAPSVVFIAGGVGITPLMSSIRYLTDQSWPGEIFLIYACTSLKDIIFRQELDYLASRHPNLHATITLSREESPEWTGPRGYITKELLLTAVPDIAARRVHMCGPPTMMDAMKPLLAQIGLSAEQVKTELFLSPEPTLVSKAAEAPVAARPRTEPVPVCTFFRSGKSAPLPPENTVLEASEDVGVNIDYSCREGYCGTCKIKLLAGQVTMAVEDALDDNDKAQNIILACQAKSTGNVTVEA